METSETLGLLLPLAWVVNHEWWQVWLIALAICPGALIVMGPLLESRRVPLHWKHQFLAFFPANPFLATFVAFSVKAVDELPDGWQLGQGWNIAGIVIFAIVYVGLTAVDFKVYSIRQMLSPTKFYHNLLYFWYGYLAAMAGISMFASPVSIAQKVLTCIPLALWAACLAKDTFFTSREELEHKWQVAHDHDWRPLGINGWHVRNLTLVRGRWVYI
jgi:hypothetical protein